ncbi:50S ribosomal protein L33 [Gloeobacter kilaueensis]|uniref:Large ribosomal subunit protein bL33 n=1 Tax=Gloeobacter kilaueensis (strain ATCC BAA-2537 / CCAP 1431/1 / ULC 316 / JS1) TaxID=1183438 RepID=U5QHZ1_GLOK1|nr:50S ribosomal protein L33 [Gloeobacter kilaueensis]AGY57280.1 50S ribosomal protein L33 [Gloeobacter kilaueensis JS1]
MAAIAEPAARLIVSLESAECQTNALQAFARRLALQHQQNKCNATRRMELKKFCSHCNKHTIHQEIK